jgi:predicted transcriptional regulator
MLSSVMRRKMIKSLIKPNMIRRTKENNKKMRFKL